MFLASKLAAAISSLMSRLKEARTLSTQQADLFALGLEQYFKEGITTQSTYIMHRNLYFISRGNYPLYARGAFKSHYSITQAHAPSSSPAHNGLIMKGLDRLRKEGYFILPAYFEDSPALTEITSQLDRLLPGLRSSRIQLQQAACINSILFDAIRRDRFIASLVELYLGCLPLIDNVTAWRLIPRSLTQEEMNSDALLFHVDLDRINFIKVFVYLSNVDAGCGPHCYIPSTHLSNLPLAVNCDRRYTDFELQGVTASRPINIVGPRGTVIIADTHCLHKGTLPTNAARDIFQVEFCDSIFGAPYSSPILKLEQDIFRDTHL